MLAKHELWVSLSRNVGAFMSVPLGGSWSIIEIRSRWGPVFECVSHSQEGCLAIEVALCDARLFVTVLWFLAGRDPIVAGHFFEISSSGELAEYCSISLQHLTMLAFSNRIERYRYFQVPKKNGRGLRLIAAPRADLKRLQKIIGQALQESYRAPDCVYGFIPGKNVANNAQRHIGKASLLNIDLEDFFPSISAARVHGLFKKRYGFPDDVANILTNLVCERGSLPQGAPSSPVISNIICFSMDKALIAFASRHKSTYTRYADDLVFSTTSRHKSGEIYDQSLEGVEAVSSEILSIVTANGFKINSAKIHLANRGTRQQVNGIVVNKKCNLPRMEYRALRVLFNNWDKLGLEDAARRYGAIYPQFRQRYYDEGEFIPERFISHVRGRLDYYTMVDQVNPVRSEPLVKLWKMFQKQTNQSIPYLALEEQVLQVSGPMSDCEIDISEDLEFLDGSAFSFDRWIVTCAHCVVSEMKGVDLSEQYYDVRVGGVRNIHAPLEAVKKSNLHDFAWVDASKCFDGTVLPKVKVNSGYCVQKGEIVTAVGYAAGRRVPEIIRAQVSEARTGGGNVRVDRAFIKGMSGGPVFNKRLEVIGIIIRGSEESVYDMNGEFVPLHLLNIYEPFQ